MKRKRDDPRGDASPAPWLAVVKDSPAFANIVAHDTACGLLADVLKVACEGEVLAAVKALWPEVPVPVAEPRLAVVGLCEPPRVRLAQKATQLRAGGQQPNRKFRRVLRGGRAGAVPDETPSQASVDAVPSRSQSQSPSPPQSQTLLSQSQVTPSQAVQAAVQHVARRRAPAAPKTTFARYAAAAPPESPAARFWQDLAAIETRCLANGGGILQEVFADLQTCVYQAPSGGAVPARDTSDAAARIGQHTYNTGGAFDALAGAAPLQGNPPHLARAAAAYAFAAGNPLAGHAVLTCAHALRVDGMRENPAACRFAMALSLAVMRAALLRLRPFAFGGDEPASPATDPTPCADEESTLPRVPELFTEICAFVEWVVDSIRAVDTGAGAAGCSASPASSAPPHADMPVWCEVLYAVGYVVANLEASDRRSFLRLAEAEVVKEEAQSRPPAGKVPINDPAAAVVPDVVPTPLASLLLRGAGHTPPPPQVADSDARAPGNHDGSDGKGTNLEWGEETMWDDASPTPPAEPSTRWRGGAFILGVLYAVAPQCVVQHGLLSPAQYERHVRRGGAFGAIAGGVQGRFLDGVWAHELLALAPSTGDAVRAGFKAQALHGWLRFARWCMTEPYAVVRYWPVLRSYATGLRMTSPDEAGTVLALRYLFVVRRLLHVMPSEWVSTIALDDCVGFLTAVANRLQGEREMRPARTGKQTYEVAMRQQQKASERSVLAVSEGARLAALIVSALCTMRGATAVHAARQVGGAAAGTPASTSNAIAPGVEATLALLRGNPDVISLCGDVDLPADAANPRSAAATTGEEFIHALLAVPEAWVAETGEIASRTQLRAGETASRASMSASPREALCEMPRIVRYAASPYPVRAGCLGGGPPPNVDTLAALLRRAVHDAAALAEEGGARGGGGGAPAAEKHVTLAIAGELWRVACTPATRTLCTVTAALAKTTTASPRDATAATRAFMHALHTARRLRRGGADGGDDTGTGASVAGCLARFEEWFQGGI